MNAASTGFDTRRAPGKIAAWVLAVVAGAAITLATFAFIYISMTVYVATYPVFGGAPRPGPSNLQRAEQLVGQWLTPIFFAAAVAVLVAVVAWAVREAHLARSMFVGIVAALILEGTILLAFPPFSWFWLFLYLIVGAVAGYLGALAAGYALESRDNVRKALQLLSAAQGPYDVAAAIGETFGRAHGGPRRAAVSLWGFDVPQPAGHAAGAVTGDLTGGRTREDPLTLWAAWGDDAARLWPEGSVLGDPGRTAGGPESDGTRGRARAVGAIEALIAEQRAGFLTVSQLPDEARSRWQADGRFSRALVAPMILASGDHVGLVVMASGSLARPTRLALRDLQTVANQAGLTLDQQRNATLRERNRLAGEVHDTLTQGFVSIKNHLGAALEGADGAGLASGSPARRQVENAEKHAHARSASVTVSYMDDLIALDVVDDGKGFDPFDFPHADNNGAGGAGLGVMRRRVEELGGAFSVESAPGEGTAVAAQLPAHPNPDPRRTQSIREERA